VSRTNLFWDFYQLSTFTNLVEHTAPTNNDKLLIWDSTANTNRYLTLAGLMTNPPTADGITNTDTFLIWSTATNAGNLYGTNPTLAKVSLSGLSNFVATVVTNVFGAARFTSSESNLVTGVVADVPHGLGGTPQEVRWVIVCKTNDVGYVVGDEVPADMVELGEGYMLGGGANATNVFASLQNAGFTLNNKASGATEPALATRWKAKAYAVRYP